MLLFQIGFNFIVKQQFSIQNDRRYYYVYRKEALKIINRQYHYARDYHNDTNHTV